MSNPTSTHAAAAKVLRQDLKRVFPDRKFLVRSKSYSGGSSITALCPADLSQSDIGRIKAMAGRYQYGHFDGMTDSYEMSNTDDNLPQVKFVFVQQARE